MPGDQAYLGCICSGDDTLLRIDNLERVPILQKYLDKSGMKSDPLYDYITPFGTEGRFYGANFLKRCFMYGYGVC